MIYHFSKTIYLSRAKYKHPLPIRTQLGWGERLVLEVRAVFNVNRYRRFLGAVSPSITRTPKCNVQLPVKPLQKPPVYSHNFARGNQVAKQTSPLTNMPKRAASTTVVKRSKTSTMTKKKYPMYRPVKVFVGKQAVPKQWFNQHRYVELQNVTLSAGIGKYIFSANGMYDPNISGTGHSPLFYDQMTAMYNHYTVLSSKVSVEIVYNGILAAALYCDDDTSTQSSVNTAAEMPDAVSTLNNGAVNKFPILYQSFNAANTYGPNPQAQDSLQGTITANPSEQLYYVLVLYDSTGPNTTVQTFWKVEYNVVWDEVVTVAQS